MDRGAPISYLVLARGTRVESSDGVEVGAVRDVLQVPVKDVFDGIVVDTPNGRRFVDGPEVAELYENLVVLGIDAEAAARLPKPGRNPAAMKLSPDDVSRSGASNAARRLWSRLSGRQ
ncbi:MAG TPA: hypothetical protein VF545_08800 [Thermoleophilaceae bacterium]|jgi:hypothetical protein